MHAMLTPSPPIGDGSLFCTKRQDPQALLSRTYGSLAESEGFEPPVEQALQRLSRPPLSTA